MKSSESLDVAPGPRDRTVVTDQGQVLSVPPGWDLLPPGDAGLTRRVKATGPTWTVKERKGRRVYSKGVWAAASQIASARRSVTATRNSPAHQKRLLAERNRRQQKQETYVDEFRDAVLAFLDFDPRYDELADAIATAVTAHATPVGSGTVARTQRISVQQRAASAVIAWMRHTTTDYDQMTIRPVKGQRRSVRRELAKQSHRILAGYRSGEPVDRSTCPLWRAVHQSS